MKNFRWLLWVLVVFPLTFFMSMDRVNMAVAAPIIRQIYHLSLFQEIMILTIFWLIYALMQVPAGLFVERIGARRGLSLASAWWSLFTVLTPFGGFYYGFLLIRGLLGLGQAVDWPSSVYAINIWFKKEEKSLANSVLLGGLYLGAAIGSTLAGLIIAALGWPWAFWIFGLLGFSTSLAWWALYSDDPRKSKYVEPEEKKVYGTELETNLSARTQLQQWKVFIKQSRFWGFGIQYFLLILVQSFYTSLLPTYLFTFKHVNIKTTGLLSSLPWFSLLITVFIIGWLEGITLRKSNSVKYARVPYAISGFIISALFLYLSMLQYNAYIAVYLMMVSMVGVGMVQVSIWSTCQDLGKEYTAAVTGWVNMWGNLSSALGPIFTGILTLLGSSFTTAVSALGLASLLGAIIWIFVKPEKPLVGVLR